VLPVLEGREKGREKADDEMRSWGQLGLERDFLPAPPQIETRIEIDYSISFPVGCWRIRDTEVLER
jgi:hypothetical protein